MVSCTVPHERQGPTGSRVGARSNTAARKDFGDQDRDRAKALRPVRRDVSATATLRSAAACRSSPTARSGRAAASPADPNRPASPAPTWTDAASRARSSACSEPRRSQAGFSGSEADVDPSPLESPGCRHLTPADAAGPGSVAAAIDAEARSMPAAPTSIGTTPPTAPATVPAAIAVPASTTMPATAAMPAVMAPAGRGALRRSQQPDRAYSRGGQCHSTQHIHVSRSETMRPSHSRRHQHD